MARGTFDGADLSAAARTLLAEQRLSVSALRSTLEDLFLAGGLRQGWSTALAVAELAAGASTRPSGLADLFRLLARYAMELPEPQAVPPHIAALATDTTRTKASMEARRLAAALTRESEDAVVVSLRAGDTDLASLPRRGLWESMATPGPPLPSSVRLADPVDTLVARGTDLGGLRDLLCENYNGYAQSYGDISFRPPTHMPSPSLTGLTEPDRVLAATVTAVDGFGVRAVREALGGIERECTLDVVRDRPLGQRRSRRGRVLAAGHRAVASEATVTERWRQQGRQSRDEVRDAAARRLLSGATATSNDPEMDAVVVPRALGTPLERFTFLRAAEALLRADRDPVVLSHPTWADGTLELEDLLARLRNVAAKGRCRGSTRPRAGAAPAPGCRPRAHRRRAHGAAHGPVFTHPSGEEEWDATDLVQRWLAHGGIPVLEPKAHDGRWTTTTVSPVPFRSLAAWPSELVEDPWALGPMPATIRLVPRWPDRVVADAFGTWSLYDPRHFRGWRRAVRCTLHDRLLALLTPFHNQKSFQALPTLADLARRGRLDPAAAAAAAVGRHEAGTLSLKLLVATLQRAFDEVFRGVWPTALAIADALCTVTRKPAQLGELLRLLATHAHEVPVEAVTVPPVWRRSRSRAAPPRATRARAAGGRPATGRGLMTDSLSELTHDTVGSRLDLLATGPAMTPNGLVREATFFSGFVTRADVTASGLLAVADVAGSRYADPGLGQRIKDSMDPVVTAGGDRLRFESFSMCNGVHARFDC